MSISEVQRRFAGAGIDWWIAGGVAIDLFLGWETRPHADLDVEMFRSDSAQLFEIFEGWDLNVVSESQLVPWSNTDHLDDSVFGVWIRSDTTAPWKVEIMLANGDRAEWRFRRDPSITMSGETLVRTTRSGIPYCTPEVQLLYKSKQARPKDDIDLARCLPRMSASQRRWLLDAIATTTPDYPWIAVLTASLS
jgi:hypothetical protein